jgi:putative tryptophan/tyrosine transport system substrate-binding protein
MDRRRFLLTSVAGILAPLVAAEGQQQSGKVYSVGILSPHPAASPQQRGSSVIRDRFRQLGWIVGQNLKIEWALAEGRDDRLPEYVEELIRRRVDVIWTLGPPAAVAAARATKTIPIVFWGVSLPVQLGLVSELARPGGNVTGVAYSTGLEVTGKQLEFLKQIAPAATRLGWIINPESMRGVSGTQYTGAALLPMATQLRLELRRYEVHGPEDFDKVFAAVVTWRAHAIGMGANALLWRERKRIVDFANRNGLAGVYGMREFVEAGGLISYGPDDFQTLRQSITYVDKILRGARPADLPVVQPSKFELVINLRTAKTFSGSGQATFS